MKTMLEELEITLQANRERFLVFARNLTGSQQEAEDCVARTFQLCVSSVSRLDGVRKPVAWATRVHRNVVFDHLRRRQKENLLSLDALPSGFEPFAEPLHPDPLLADPEEALIRRDTDRRLVAALRNGMHPRYFDAIQMLILQDESYESYAARHGLAIGTVKSRVFRARHMAAKILQKELTA